MSGNNNTPSISAKAGASKASVAAGAHTLNGDTSTISLRELEEMER